MDEDLRKSDLFTTREKEEEYVWGTVQKGFEYQKIEKDSW